MYFDENLGEEYDKYKSDRSTLAFWFDNMETHSGALKFDNYQAIRVKRYSWGEYGYTKQCFIIRTFPCFEIDYFREVGTCEYAGSDICKLSSSFEKVRLSDAVKCSVDSKLKSIDFSKWESAQFQTASVRYDGGYSMDVDIVDTDNVKKTIQCIYTPSLTGMIYEKATPDFQNLLTMLETILGNTNVSRDEYIERWKKEHLCTKCGGEFSKGTLKKCTGCGQIKDYRTPPKIILPFWNFFKIVKIMTSFLFSLFKK